MLDAPALACILDPFVRVLVDLGTGDGRFVDLIARRDPGCLAIGIDACREPLIERSRRAPANALYLIANALTLPDALDGVATRITVNFP
jgi:tRNA G46 methylase TrmB